MHVTLKGCKPSATLLSSQQQSNNNQARKDNVFNIESTMTIDNIEAPPQCATSTSTGEGSLIDWQLTLASPDDSEKIPSTSSGQWTKALYHITTSVLGPPAVAALPFGFAFLGLTAGVLVLFASAAVSFYSGVLLISLQQESHRTYSQIADSVMQPNFSRNFVRPFQMIIFFTVSTITVLLIGEFFQVLQELWGLNLLSQSIWIIISGVIVLGVALVPSLSEMWQLSLIGTVTALVSVILMIVGIVVSIGDGCMDDVSYGHPQLITGKSSTSSFAFGVLLSFGTVAFAFGGHSVLPDVQASLECDASTAQSSMTKGLRGAYCFILPCYLSVAVAGYIAFGSSVSGFIVDDMADHVGHPFVASIYFIFLINTLALGAIYIQAGFVLIEDFFPFVREKVGIGVNYRPFISRFLFIAISTFTAVAVPFFGYLAALSGTIGFTPLTFIYPFLFWNRAEAQRESPRIWKIRLHNFLAIMYTLLGFAGATGALYYIVENASTFKVFGQ